MFEIVPVLSQSECNEVSQTIHSLASHWKERGEGLPFFTLGTASYLDSEKDSERLYRIKSDQTNPLLLNHFKPLYDKIQEVLENKLECPCVYDPEKALPGFHIFQYSPQFKKPMASVHFDLQFEGVCWDSYQECDTSRTLSFTLPIVLPENKTGLNVWDLSFEESKKMSDDDLDRYIQNHPPRLIDYKEGVLVLHKGRILHQIAPSPNMKEGQERITLQGHALFCDGAYRMYW